MLIRSMMLFVLATVGAIAEEIPSDHFGHPPIIELPRVSPDGRFVASLLNTAEGPTICVSEFGSRELEPIVRLKSDEDRIDWIRWANDERLLISVSSPESTPSAKYRVSRLYQVKRDGEGMRQIRRKRSRTEPEWTRLLDTTNILSVLPDEPNHILMQLYDERDKGLAVFKVDIANNDFEKQFINEYDVDRWYANDTGEVVLGLESQREKTTIWYRPGSKDEWEPLHTRRYFEDETFAPISISGSKAIVISDHELGRQAVWRYDIEAGEFEELIFSVEKYDIDDAILSNDQTRLLGVDFYEHYRAEHYFDEEAAQTAELIASSFPDYHTVVASRSRDEKRLIVRATRDDAPPRYIWLDLEAKTGGVWFSTYPHLEGKALSTVEPFEFEARDGLTLTGYLTLPVTGAGKPPLIVFPHGGPHARDYRYFDPFVQFFANRGYAVMQVNFRGSEGFGTPFETAGYRQWGMALQQDIYDAIDWLSRQDRVDAENKCIVGASYGGYAALVAAYQKPREFRCVASIAGVADLYEKVKLDALNPFRKPSIIKLIGDPGDGDDRNMLKTNSAINNVRDIRAPLLVVHGVEDTRVRIAQSRAFRDRAEDAGVDIEYLELETGTHFLDGYNNRLAVFEALDRFLDSHL